MSATQLAARGAAFLAAVSARRALLESGARGGCQEDLLDLCVACPPSPWQLCMHILPSQPGDDLKLWRWLCWPGRGENGLEHCHLLVFSQVQAKFL